MTQEYECEGDCQFWQIMHGENKAHIDYSEEKWKRCARCMKPQRLEAYKSFWAERSKI